MPAIPSSGIPGIATPSAGYPQYGVLGSAGKQKIVVANNAAQKTQFMAQGALVWFSTSSAAQTFINSQTGFLSGNIPGVSSFFGALMQKSTWIRVGEAVFALVLLDVGLKSFTGFSVIETAGKTGKTAAKAGAFL